MSKAGVSVRKLNSIEKYSFVKRAFEERDYILLDEVYVNSKTPLKFECKKHQGTINSIRFNDLQRGQGCRRCGIEKRAESRRTPIEVVIYDFKERGYTLLGHDYKNANSRLRYRCEKHPEKVLFMRYADLVNGARCPYCVGTGKLSYKQVAREFVERGYTLLEKEYINSTTKMRYMCPEHPHKKTKITYKNLRNGHGCPYCAGKGRLTFDEVKEEFKGRGYELLETEYIDSGHRMRFVCPNHPNKDTRISFSSLRRGSGCAYCAKVAKYTIEEVKIDFQHVGYELLETRYVNNSLKLSYRCPRHPNENTSVAYRDFLRGDRCRFCANEARSGENNPRWNSSYTDEERRLKRNTPMYREWRITVYKRDHYTCQCCSKNRKTKYHAHHLQGYNWCPELRYDISNGVTLCEECHENFHSTYGKGNNTREQFEEWIEVKRAQGFNVLYRAKGTSVSESNVIGERSNTEVTLVHAVPDLRSNCANNSDVTQEAVS